MEDFNKYPKSIKKAVRYIKQDASLDQLEEIRQLLEKSICGRMSLLQKASGERDYVEG